MERLEIVRNRITAVTAVDFHAKKLRLNREQTKAQEEKKRIFFQHRDHAFEILGTNRVERKICTTKLKIVMIRVLVAFHQPIIGEGLEHLLKKEKGIQLCPKANTLRSLQLRLSRHQPDVIMIGIPNLFHQEENDVLTSLLLQRPRLRCIALATEHQPDTFRTYWQMGLRGYLLGYTSKAELMLCLHSVAEGGWYYPPMLRTELLANQDGPHSLTAREREILLHLAAGRTTREIADELRISEQTILTYRKRLQQKLDACNVAHLISRAYHQGYLQTQTVEH